MHMEKKTRLLRNERQQADVASALDSDSDFPLVLSASSCDAAWENLAALCRETLEIVRVLVIDYQRLV